MKSLQVRAGVKYSNDRLIRCEPHDLGDGIKWHPIVDETTGYDL